jgi:precorrin-4 C11-methyltransferase
MAKVWFVGAGPGDPELITLKGKALLERAGAVIYAGSLVNPALLDWVKEGAAVYNSASMTLEEIVRVMKDAWGKGMDVVRLHTGDGSLYGAIGEQMDALDGADIPYEVVPGVSSLFAAAAALKREYTLPGVSQTLIVTRCAGRTPVPEGEQLSALASHGASMALFLSAGLVREVRDELTAAGTDPAAPAAIVCRASWPDEKVVLGTVGELPEMAEKAGVTKTALILIGRFLEGQGKPSRLYDGSFSHGYREAEKAAGVSVPEAPAPEEPPEPRIKLAVVAVSKTGAELAASLVPRFPGAKAFVYAPYALEGQEAFDSVMTITKEVWNRAQSFLFICASGIAVRAIAPLVRSKHEDPAVAVCPDNGAFVISLLSGHEGGANALASEIAALLNAVPVITTASEMSPPVLPRNLCLGIGCKRGTPSGALRSAVGECFAQNGLSPLRLRVIASIDIKQDEPGLAEFAGELGVSCVFYSPGELAALGGGFSGSDFVQKTTGVDNVCERAAVLASRGGRLLVKKTVFSGVTVAVAEGPADLRAARSLLRFAHKTV